MSEYVIRILGVGSDMGMFDHMPATYLKSYDVDAYDQVAATVFTQNIHDALHFASRTIAFTTWQTQSTARPLRDDGEPNRPLTAFSVSIEEYDPLEVPEEPT